MHSYIYVVRIHIVNSGRKKKGIIVGIDPNKTFTDIAKKYFEKEDVLDVLDLRLEYGIPALRKMVEDDNDSRSGSYDFAFVDAHKPEYWQYYELLLLLIRKGGIMVFDNTLWGGRVAMSAKQWGEGNGMPHEFTRSFREFNLKLRDDQRVRQCMTDLGDGATFVTKLV